MKHFLRLHLFLSLGLLSLVLAPLTQAASYKWTDSNGDVHYSQRPPQGKSYEKIKTPKRRPASSSATNRSSADSIDNSTKSGDDVLKKERANNTELRKKSCEQSKYNLNVFSNYSRIKDPDGKVRVITDKERADRTKQAEDGIREFCG